MIVYRAQLDTNLEKMKNSVSYLWCRILEAYKKFTSKNARKHKSRTLPQVLSLLIFNPCSNFQSIDFKWYSVLYKFSPLLDLLTGHWPTETCIVTKERLQLRLYVYKIRIKALLFCLVTAYYWNWKSACRRVGHLSRCLEAHSRAASRRRQGQGLEPQRRP